MPPPSPSPTSSGFPRDTFTISASDPLSDRDTSEARFDQCVAVPMDDDELEEEDEEEPDLDEDDDYKPTNHTHKRTSAVKSSRKPPPKKASSKAMSARYNPGTNVTLPPARPHPGLAPAQPFDPYIPPSQQHQPHFMSLSQSAHSAPNTPMGHKPQYSPVDDFQQHPHTATLPPLSSVSNSASVYYPTLPPMNVSPGRAQGPEGLPFYPGMTLVPSPPPSYGEFTQPSTHQYTLSPNLQQIQPPMMTRHHSFSGPYYPSGQQQQQQHHQQQQQMTLEEQRNGELADSASIRRLSSRSHDASLPPTSHAQTLVGYHEVDPTFSPGSSLSSAHGPESSAYALHPGSPSVSPPAGFLGAHFPTGASHYISNPALHQEMHHHQHPHQYIPQPRMVYVNEVSGMQDQ